MAKGRGFTIVEVMLFMAVSALLLGIALTFTSGTLKNARYADTTKAFETYIEQQYAEVQAGTATRTASTPVGCLDPGGAVGASDNCIVLGRAFTLSSVAGQDKSIKKYTVVASATPSAPPNNDFEAFSYSDVRVHEDVDEPIDTYNLDWGTELSWLRYMRAGTTSWPLNRIAILRSPVSESIYIFTFNDATPDDLTDLAAGIIAVNANKPAVLCFSSTDFGTASSSLVASVTLNGSTSIDSIDSTLKARSDTRVGGLTC